MYPSSSPFSWFQGAAPRHEDSVENPCCVTPKALDNAAPGKRSATRGKQSGPPVSSTPKGLHKARIASCVTLSG